MTSVPKANPDITVIRLRGVRGAARQDRRRRPRWHVDVVLIDVIWPAEFGSKHIVADVTSKWPETWKQEMLGGAVATPQFDSHFYGVPWILDTKYLFFNAATSWPRPRSTRGAPRHLGRRPQGGPRHQVGRGRQEPTGRGPGSRPRP